MITSLCRAAMYCYSVIAIVRGGIPFFNWERNGCWRQIKKLIQSMGYEKVFQSFIWLNDNWMASGIRVICSWVAVSFRPNKKEMSWQGQLMIEKHPTLRWKWPNDNNSAFPSGQSMSALKSSTSTWCIPWTCRCPRVTSSNTSASCRRGSEGFSKSSRNSLNLRQMRKRTSSGEKGKKGMSSSSSSSSATFM